MSDAIANIEKRRGRPPTGATPVMVRLAPDQLAALDKWISENDATLTRPAAIRAALRQIIGE